MTVRSESIGHRRSAGWISCCVGAGCAGSPGREQKPAQYECASDCGDEKPALHAAYGTGRRTTARVLYAGRAERATREGSWSAKSVVAGSACEPARAAWRAATAAGRGAPRAERCCVGDCGGGIRLQDGRRCEGSEFGEAIYGCGRELRRVGLFLQQAEYGSGGGSLALRNGHRVRPAVQRSDPSRTY